MDLDRYQEQAIRTRQKHDKESIIVSLLGLAGETGELLSEYKKHLRDGNSHILHRDCVREELGDLLWYLSDIASHFDLSLSDVAKANLDKSDQRWGNGSHTSRQLHLQSSFDDVYPNNERLPLAGIAEIREIEPLPNRTISTYINDVKMGEDLTARGITHAL